MSETTAGVPAKSRVRGKLFAIWTSALLILIGLNFLPRFIRRWIPDSLFGFAEFLLWTTVIAIALFWIALAIRFILRKVFWRVGMRLALSYFLVGFLPIVFFAFLIAFIGYVAAGILSQTAFRVERQSTMAKLEEWNLEHALTSGRPAGALRNLEIYDSADGTIEKLPEWLQRKTFTGLVRREGDVLLVSSKIYNRGPSLRSVVLIQPMDEVYAEALEKKNGMRVLMSNVRRTNERERRSDRSGAPPAATSTTSSVPAASPAAPAAPATNTTASEGEAATTTTAPRERRGPGITISSKTTGTNVRINLEDAAEPAKAEQQEKSFNDFIRDAIQRGGVIWGDMTPALTEWETGVVNPGRNGVSMISNPWRNLNTFYFGNWEYSQVVLAVIGSIAGTLAVVYFFALLLAAGLIFSISRAVNRIEKGTRAVERGDFSYRIGMRAKNQLGQVAQSFDSMTQSVSSLLGRVAEQERLQSEIDIAATIQRNLLPREVPHAKGIAFSAHFEPTAQIGGDYYDVFTLDHDRIAVAIGDVSGHGLSTGLVMAMVKAGMTTLVEEGVDEVSLFKRLNDLVYKSTERRAFMTLGFTIFDLNRATIRHTNAGHLFPYLLRAGEPPRSIEAPSLPLGVRSVIEPVTIELDLRSRDTIVYLSDGIVEAQDPKGEPFGFDLLEAILAKKTGSEPAAIQEEILARVSVHASGRLADDDRTVMILRLDAVGSGSAREPHFNELMTR
jgi:HAMP domain-containing protein